METQKPQFDLETGVIGDFAKHPYNGRLYQKYIVDRNEKSFVWHAHPVIGDNIYHREIASWVGARRVIGGGRTTIKDDCLVIFDESGTYGSVRREILEAFAPVLLPAYQKIAPQIKRVEIR
jgi:hypothetical protein